MNVSYSAVQTSRRRHWRTLALLNEVVQDTKKPNYGVANSDCLSESMIQ